MFTLSLSLSGIRRLKLYNLCLWQESSQSKLKSSISRKEQESFSCLETSNVYVSWLLWFLDSFRLFVSQAENQAEKHAEHKIWRRRKYISCKQCHCCKLTLHLLSRTLYSSPPSQNSLVHFNPVNPFQEPVSRINQRSSAPSSELDSSCLFLLLSAIWQQPRMPPQVTLMSMYSHLVHVPSAVCLFVEPCLAIDLGGRPFLMIQYSLNRVCICALAAWCTIFRIESLANTHTGWLQLFQICFIVLQHFFCLVVGETTELQRVEAQQVPGLSTKPGKGEASAATKHSMCKFKIARTEVKPWNLVKGVKRCQKGVKNHSLWPSLVDTTRPNEARAVANALPQQVLQAVLHSNLSHHIPLPYTYLPLQN